MSRSNLLRPFFTGRSFLVVSFLSFSCFAGVSQAEESSPEAAHLEALPAVVKLRTAALLLSDQQGGELSMVSSVVRRPSPGGEGTIDAFLTVEIDDSSLREALPEGGQIEAFVYLVDRRLEIFDSVSAGWILPGPPTGPESKVSAEPVASESVASEPVASEPVASELPVEPTTASDEGIAVVADGASQASEGESPAVEPVPETVSEDPGSGLDPVRFSAVFPAPPPGDYVFRVLFRAGEHFGLRSLPLVVPVGNDSVASMLEPVLETAPPENDRWARVSPAGRGPGDAEALPGISMLRRGSKVPLSFARSSKSDVGAVRLEFERDGDSRILTVEQSRSSAGVIRGHVNLPEDLEEGQYHLRLVADSARPSLTANVLVLDPSLPAIRWTELDRLAEQETTFSGESLRMPASERQRVIATRRELFQVLVDMEGGLEPALARFRALEQSLDEQLGTETIDFLEAQLSKVVSQIMRKTRKKPELTVGLAWLFMEHAEQHRKGGSYRFSNLSQDVSLEILRVLGEDSKSKAWAAECMAVLGGWLQRQRFLQPAESVLKEALVLEPEAPYVLSPLAAIHERYDQVKEAVQVLGRLVKADPSDPAAQVRLAVAHHRAGDLEQAIAELDRVLGSNEGSGAGGPWWLLLAHQEKVRVEVDRGRLEQAQQALNNGLRAYPQDPVLLLAQPWLLYLRGQPDQARQGLLNLASSPNGENARNRFHAWPRARLDALSRKMSQTTRAASPELAALAQIALEKTQ